MRTEVKSANTAKNSNGSTQFNKLTKAQLIELLNGRITRPLTPGGLYRCAVSVLGKWCNDVVSGGYASMYDLTSKLEALQNIYRQQ